HWCFGRGFFEQSKAELRDERVFFFIYLKELKIGAELIFYSRFADKIRLEHDAHVLDRLAPKSADRLARRRHTYAAVTSGCSHKIAGRGKFLGDKLAAERDIYLVMLRFV